MNPLSHVINPLNYIKLLDSEGNFLKQISIGRAALLISYDNASVNMRERFLQLKISKEEYFRLNEKSFKSKDIIKKVYGNFVFQHPDGSLLFVCDAKKALWYVIRNLCDIISEDPPVLRMKFFPEGPGVFGDEYYESLLKNICVVCGSNFNLTRHHVVPICYRKHLPKKIKSHSHHDILALCDGCHRKYETQAEILKRVLSFKYNCPVRADFIDRDLRKIRNVAKTIMRYKDRIPEQRLNDLYSIIKEHFQKEDISEDDLLNASEINDYFGEGKYFPHGEYVMMHIKGDVGYQAFFEMWRGHFVKNMKPQFLPENWDIKRCVKKDKARNRRDSDEEK